MYIKSKELGYVLNVQDNIKNLNKLLECIRFIEPETDKEQISQGSKISKSLVLPSIKKHQLSLTNKTLKPEVLHLSIKSQNGHKTSTFQGNNTLLDRSSPCTLRSFWQQEKQKTQKNNATPASLFTAQVSPKPIYPTLKVIVESAAINPFKYNPAIPLELPTTIERQTLLRKINDLQLRFPELHITNLNIAEVFDECIKNLNREDDKDFIYIEWLQLYKAIALNIKILREIFLSYNLNYLQRKGIKFTSESSHLEKAFKMQFETFKVLCKEMKVSLNDYSIMFVYYISTRPYKKLPCTF